MNQAERRNLQINRVKLVHNLEAVDILDYLLEDGVLTENDCELITNGKTRKERAQLLLTLLPTRGPGAYGSFQRALEQGKYDYLQELLTGLQKEENSDITETQAASIIRPENDLQVCLNTISCCKNLAFQKCLKDHYFLLVNNIEPHDVIDHFYQEQLIGDDVIELVRVGKTRKERCLTFIGELSRCSSDNILTVLKASLNKKYKYISDLIRTSDNVYETESRCSNKSNKESHCDEHTKRKVSECTITSRTTETNVTLPMLSDFTIEERPSDYAGTLFSTTNSETRQEKETCLKNVQVSKLHEIKANILPEYLQLPNDNKTGVLCKETSIFSEHSDTSHFENSLAFSRENTCLKNVQKDNHGDQNCEQISTLLDVQCKSFEPETFSLLDEKNNSCKQEILTGCKSQSLSEKGTCVKCCKKPQQLSSACQLQSFSCNSEMRQPCKKDPFSCSSQIQNACKHEHFSKNSQFRQPCEHETFSYNSQMRQPCEHETFSCIYQTRQPCEHETCSCNCQIRQQCEHETVSRNYQTKQPCEHEAFSYNSQIRQQCEHETFSCNSQMRQPCEHETFSCNYQTRQLCEHETFSCKSQIRQPCEHETFSCNYLISSNAKHSCEHNTFASVNNSSQAFSFARIDSSAYNGSWSNKESDTDSINENVADGTAIISARQHVKISEPEIARTKKPVLMTMVSTDSETESHLPSKPRRKHRIKNNTENDITHRHGDATLKISDKTANSNNEDALQNEMSITNISSYQPGGTDVSLTGRHLVVTFNYLSTLINQGNFDKFELFSSNLQKRYSDDPDMTCLLGYLHASRDLFKTDFDSAKKHIDKAFDIVPKTSNPKYFTLELFTSKTRMYITQKKLEKLEKALDDAKMIIETDPLGCTGRAAGWLYMNDARNCTAQIGLLNFRNPKAITSYTKLHKRAKSSFQKALSNFQRDGGKDGPFGFGYALCRLAILLLRCDDTGRTMDILIPPEDDVKLAGGYILKLEDSEISIPKILEMHFALAKCDYQFRRKNSIRALEYAEQAHAIASDFKLLEFTEHANNRCLFLRKRSPGFTIDDVTEEEFTSILFGHSSDSMSD